MSELETRRLVLRPPVLDDFEGWAALSADPENTRYIGGVQPRATAFRGLLAMAGAWSLQGFGMFSVIEKSTGYWIGRVGPWSPEGWPGTEIGWTLARSAWGKGYAIEAASAAMDWAIEQLGWTDIIHTIDPANLASQSVARRLGSQRIGAGTLPPPYAEMQVDIWGQRASAWRARSNTTVERNAR